jgi:hypothetical protein
MGKMTETEFSEIINPHLLAEHIDKMLPLLIMRERDEDKKLGIERLDEYWESKLLASKHMIIKWFSEFLSDVSVELYFERNVKKNFSEIRQFLELSISLDPRMSEALNNLACLLARNGDFIGALQQIEKALMIDPDNTTAFKNYNQFSAESSIKSTIK